MHKDWCFAIVYITIKNYIIKALITNTRANNMSDRAGARAVDLGGPSVYQGGPKCEIMHKAPVFKRVSLLIGGAKHFDWGG